MSGSSQITPWAAVSASWRGVGFEGNNLSSPLSGRRKEGRVPANRPIHQKNCQTIVCFFINKLLILLLDKAGKVQGERFLLFLFFLFPPQHNPGAEFSGVAVSFSTAGEAGGTSQSVRV